jgi:hypothetical protein
MSLTLIQTFKTFIIQFFEFSKSKQYIDNRSIKIKLSKFKYDILNYKTKLCTNQFVNVSFHGQQEIQIHDWDTFKTKVKYKILIPYINNYFDVHGIIDLLCLKVCEHISSSAVCVRSHTHLVFNLRKIKREKLSLNSIYAWSKFICHCHSWQGNTTCWP